MVQIEPETNFRSGTIEYKDNYLTWNNVLAIGSVKQLQTSVQAEKGLNWENKTEN